jgi:hypothetical protein
MKMSVVYFLLEIVLSILVLLYFLRIARGTVKLLRKWALGNSIEILGKNLFLFGHRPFTLSGNQPIYRIRAKLSNGETRMCWIRCGSFLGINMEKYEVVWDDSLEKSDGKLSN